MFIRIVKFQRVFFRAPRDKNILSKSVKIPLGGQVSLGFVSLVTIVLMRSNRCLTTLTAVIFTLNSRFLLKGFLLVLIFHFLPSSHHLGVRARCFKYALQPSALATFMLPSQAYFFCCVSWDQDFLQWPLKSHRNQGDSLHIENRFP